MPLDTLRALREMGRLLEESWLESLQPDRLYPRKEITRTAPEAAHQAFLPSALCSLPRCQPQRLFPMALPRAVQNPAFQPLPRCGRGCLLEEAPDLEAPINIFLIRGWQNREETAAVAAQQSAGNRMA